MSITTNCVINQVTILSNKLFHFSYKKLNAPSEKIMSLWNFCHPFPVFYDWNTSTNDRIWFFRVFSRNHFLEGGFTFQWGWVLFFRWEGFIFKWVGAPWGVLVLMGGGFKKKGSMGGHPPPPPPPPWEILHKAWQYEYGFHP